MAATAAQDSSTLFRVARSSTRISAPEEREGRYPWLGKFLQDVVEIPYHSSTTANSICNGTVNFDPGTVSADATEMIMEGPT